MLFTWKALKSNNVKIFNKILNNTPVSLLWIKKVSSLIAGGRYKYFSNQLFFNKNKYFTKGKNIKLVKLFIIENAFVFMIKPFFSNYISMGNYDLNEYLFGIVIKI